MAEPIICLIQNSASKKAVASLLALDVTNRNTNTISGKHSYGLIATHPLPNTDDPRFERHSKVLVGTVHFSPAPSPSSRCESAPENLIKFFYKCE